MDTDKLNFNKSGGLIPVIAQDALSGKVLMQAYMNRQALEQTLSEGRLTLFSRSKNRIWTKGETSGNFMMVTDILSDCDKDCLLIKVTSLRTGLSHRTRYLFRGKQPFWHQSGPAAEPTFGETKMLPEHFCFSKSWNNC
jgi:phosphoribosyl-AMP cyclohydrolase